MKKIIFRILIFTLLLIFSFITYLSTIGIETDALNDQISKEVKKINNQLELDLDKISIFLDPFEFKLVLKTIGANLKNKNKLIKLESVKSNIDIIIYNYTENQLVVIIPENKNILKSDVQDFIVNAIEKTYRLEAKAYLPNRVEELAKTYGLSYKKVKINNAKTRWGSCSSENNINLSLQLMRLPDYLIDYVILHELAHTKVKNHSIHFWDFLDSITDSKAKNLDKELKSFYLQVF